MADNGDEDAIYINEFEDQIVEAFRNILTSHSALWVTRRPEPEFESAPELVDFGPWRAKQRGKGFTKKGKGGNTYNQGSNAGFMGRKRSLADRIANSTCRLCGMAGHWKRECPQRAENKKPEQSTLNEGPFGVPGWRWHRSGNHRGSAPWRSGLGGRARHKIFQNNLKGNPRDHETLHLETIDHQQGQFLHDAMVVDRVCVGSIFSQNPVQSFATLW